MGEDPRDMATQALLALEPLQVLDDDAVFVGSQVSAPAAMAESAIRSLLAALSEARRGAERLRDQLKLLGELAEHSERLCDLAMVCAGEPHPDGYRHLVRRRSGSEWVKSEDLKCTCGLDAAMQAGEEGDDGK